MSREALITVMEREVARWCREPMRWGVDDCALACANIICDALGYDPAAPWRTGYVDRDGARAVLGALGLGFALQRAAKAHGWRRVDPRQARPGDVGLLLQDGNPVTVMCKAPGWFVGRSEYGAAILPAVNAAVPARSVRLCWAPV